MAAPGNWLKESFVSGTQSFNDVYKYKVTFDKIIHGDIVTNNYCRFPDYRSAVEYKRALMMKDGFSNFKIMGL